LSVTPFRVGPEGATVEIGGPKLFLIAGPCVIESRESSLRHAEAIAAVAKAAGVPLIFKSSFDKANRTSHASFRGPGPDEGLAILAEVRSELGLPVLTDVHEVGQCAATAEAVDVLQIPALLCRQTDLIRAAAATGTSVNIKKGQFMAPWDMKHPLAKAKEAGGTKTFLTERGTTFGYGNLVNDFRSLPIMAEFGAPVVFDATHSVQLPSAGGAVSTGERRFIEPLAGAAVAVGVNGLFMEVHEDPDHALSDGPNSLALSDLPRILTKLVAIHAACNEHK
jgi:2-dehydro-3-deoxyphosphooctonate aldolase (KDO 8-P synthase)